MITHDVMDNPIQANHTETSDAQLESWTQSHQLGIINSIIAMFPYVVSPGMASTHHLLS